MSYFSLIVSESTNGTLSSIGKCSTAQPNDIVPCISTSQINDKSETESETGICSLFCLAHCLASSDTSRLVSSPISDEEINSLSNISSNSKLKPFLKPSLFSFVPSTIRFYVKGNRVKKPSSKHLSKLTWCHNSLLPLVIRQSLELSHFKVVDEGKQWIGYWGRHLKSSQYNNIKAHQKVNHFPGEFHVGRKDRLWQHIYDMMKHFDNGKWFIMPVTYILPRDMRKLRAYLSGDGSSVRHLILKPPASARGSGISIISKYSEVPQKTSLVAQQIYVYVPSLDPLRIYIYDEGLVRFASVAYEPTVPTSYSNQYMHLTNYSINKTYAASVDQDGTTINSRAVKWKLSEFWAYLKLQGHDVDALRANIESIAVKALIACESSIRLHSASHCSWPFISHELFGMDILIDSSFRPWLMEMNISPALLSPSPVDVAVKSPLAKDVLNMAGIPFPLFFDDECESSSVSFKYSLYYRTRNYSKHKNSAHLAKELWHLNHFKQHSLVHCSILDNLSDADVRILTEFEDELNRCGAFKLVFPTGQETLEDLDYLPCISEPLYSNLLLMQWQIAQSENRLFGINRLEKLCSSGVHIAKIISENLCEEKSVELMQTSNDDFSKNCNSESIAEVSTKNGITDSPFRSFPALFNSKSEDKEESKIKKIRRVRTKH